MVEYIIKKTLDKEHPYQITRHSKYSYDVGFTEMSKNELADLAKKIIDLLNTE